MDKILSARIDENIILQINRLSKRLQISKKKVIEDAVNQYVKEVDAHQKTDILLETHGIWSRNEAVESTIRKSRKAFEKSMKRHSL